jgi:hypothetical protein
MSLIQVLPQYHLIIKESEKSNSSSFFSIPYLV